ncbi:MAG: hypothetical protein J6S50_05660 [Oscillospiraceae bacterium]|nr:hypothetical protein [Lachnospiraceae bacterium]MBO7727981.1 hypothetical protein [Oscillospiraceae bacterium]
MDEFDMNWLRGRDYIEVTFPARTKEKSLLLKMAEEGVEGVVITAQNKDGSVVGHVPLGCVLFRRPRKKVEQSPEHRAKSIASLTTAREAKGAKTDENEANDDLPFEPEMDGFLGDDYGMADATEVIGWNE